MRKLSVTSRCLVDPWLLPNTPEHESSTQSKQDVTLPTPIPRPHESIEAKRARLIYQSRKRGTLETDLLLSTFANDHLAEMSLSELNEYDKLLDEPDWDIYYWSTEKREPPARWQSSPLLSKLRVHTRNEGKVTRRMPDLSGSPLPNPPPR
ncbi:DUF339-domain-containing protein [Rickenella mellea]|uniref:Succinate dehydrogenase assembly factor 2, mitochondrial n=1 Tax=Rickenella mellea TaxID=50990 RepID=A0A4Y7QEA8_9AGAM|nr:DUF339-domain-containing protein [Rickenella mellea]